MSSLVGTGALVRSILRRDRVRLLVWVLGIALSVMGSVASFATTYPTAADRQARAEVLDTPVASLFVGHNYSPDDYSYGAMTAHELLPLTAVAVALMSIFLVVRHTRAEEESGRADLIRSSAVGRHAPATAALVVAGGANLVLCGLLAAGLPVSLEGLSVSGSLAFAAATAGVGLVFTGLALLAAQLTTGARSALGVASIAMGAAYVLRAVGDMAAGPLAWLSPFGWASATRAYVDERWLALVPLAAVAAVLVDSAFWIGARRDVGAGLLADRPGPATASPLLATPFGLALRLQRATLAWWALSLFVLGLVYGGVADSAGRLYENVSAFDEYLARIGAAAAADQFLALTLFIGALIAAGYTIQSVLHLRRQEVAGRAEAVLAAPVSRARFLGGDLAMSLAGSTLLLLAYGVGAGLSRSISAGDGRDFWRLVGAALAYVPALWVFAGLAVTLVGLVPKAAAGAWAVFGALVFIGFLGPLLKLPAWAFDLSPIEHVPRLPVAQFSLAPLAVLLLVAAGLVAAGVEGFRRREVGAG